MNVRVYINQSQALWRYFEGYTKGDPLALALSFDHPMIEVERMLDLTFAALNVDPDMVRPLGTLTPAEVTKYHQQFPSLSVGDVVVIDTQVFAVASIGWELLGWFTPEIVQ